MLKDKALNLDGVAVPVIVAIAATGITFSPFPLAIRLIAGGAGVGICGYKAMEVKGDRDRLLRLRNKQESDLESQKALIEAKAIEIENNLNSLQLSEAELAAKRNRWEIEEREAREALRAYIEREESRFLDVLEREEKESREQLRIDLESNQAAILSQMDSAIAGKEAILDALEVERVKKTEALEAELSAKRDLFESELADKRRRWKEERDKQREQDQREIEEAEQVLVKEFKAYKDGLLGELEEIEKELKSQSQKDYEAWLVPHIQEMDERIREIQALKGTVQVLREQIAEDRTIRLCPDAGTVHGDRANAVLLWLRDQGVPCDYLGAIVLRDGTFVLNFEPWEVGSKSERRIKGLLLACQVKFGLQEPPQFEPNGEARAWSLTLFPARSRESLRLEEFYSQKLPETNLGESFRDLEPAIKNGVARQLNYQEQVQEMMAFTPPVPISKPRSHQITELEMACFKWFYFWRGLATDGQAENITTREGLLYHVYGVREGRASSSYDPILCESLGQRVKRVLAILRVEEVEVNEE